MKGKQISLNIRYIIYSISFVLAIITVYLLLPKNDDYERYFEVGKPWAYDELMAPKDFAIYKSDKELAEERSEALKYLEPYVRYIEQGEGSRITNVNLSIRERIYRC